MNVQNVKSITEVDLAIDKWHKDLEGKKKNQIDVIENNVAKKMSFDDSFNILGDQLLLFDYIASGHEENYEDILKIIKKERKIKTKKDFVEENENEENKKLNEENNSLIINLVNHTNIDGFTPLYFACLNGHVKVVDLLVQNSADHLLKCGV